MALVTRIGKNALWSGAPLRAMVKWEPLPFPKSDQSLVDLSLKCVAAEEGDVEKSQISTSITLEKAKPSQVELPTDQLIPGVYELSIAGPDAGKLSLPEPVWIFSRSQYLRLAHERAGEEFVAGPPIERIEHLKAFVEELIRGRLRFPVPDQARDRGLLSIFAASPEGSLERPISSSPIQWTTEAIVEEANYIAIGGVKSFDFRLELTRDSFGLRFQAMLHEPLSLGTCKYLQDPELSDLHLLNFKRDLKDFVAQIQAAPLNPQVELNVKHAIEAHPVLRISNSPDPRPAPRAMTADGKSS